VGARSPPTTARKAAGSLAAGSAALRSRGPGVTRVTVG
jgi:hypothetical protein